MLATTLGCMFPPMETIGSRIAAARENKGLNQSELARRLGVRPQSVQAWEADKNTPRPRRLADIAAALGVDVGSLVDMKSLGPVGIASAYGQTARYLPRMSGGNPEPRPGQEAEIAGEVEEWGDETPLGDDVVALPFLKEVELAAGSGRTAVELSSDRMLRFGKYTLKREGVQADQAVAVTVRGNSMEPKLPDGSTVAVNRADTKIVDGKTYAINHAGQLRVKLLYRLPGGGLRIRSHNREEHPDEEYSFEQVIEQEITVIGRVFWGAMFF